MDLFGTKREAELEQAPPPSIPKKKPNRRDPVKRNVQLKEAQKVYRQRRKLENQTLQQRHITLLDQLCPSGESASELDDLVTQQLDAESRNKALRQSEMSRCHGCSTQMTHVNQLSERQASLLSRIQQLEKTGRSLLGSPVFPVKAELPKDFEFTFTSTPPQSVSPTHSRSHEPNNRSRPSVNFSPDPSNFRIQSSVELFGTIDIHLEEMALRCLPSLRNNIELDSLLSTMQDLATCTDTRRITPLFVKLLAHRHNLYDACNASEKPRAIEFVSRIGIAARAHANHWRPYVIHSTHEYGALAASLLPLNPTAARENAARFLERLRRLPSLRGGAEEMVEDFSSALVLYLKETRGGEEGGVLFFRVVKLTQGLMTLCNNADRIQLNTELELLRVANRELHDTKGMEEDLAQQEPSPPLTNALSSLSLQSTDTQESYTVPSAVDKFGPVDVDYVIPALNALPSLTGCPQIQETVTVFCAIASSTDKRVIKKLSFKLLSVHHILYDRCNMVDRAKAVELTYSLNLRNKLHTDYTFAFMYEKGALPTGGMDMFKSFDGDAMRAKKRIETFISSVLALPSLKEWGLLICELTSALMVRFICGVMFDHIVFRLLKRCLGCLGERAEEFGCFKDV
ncbi:hypothetical protein BC830DRAFT_230831 [Chytriomyces sp. MP71]|nr:hypothetical protein BC830DRAFT_230831 [Chytriomyces sp. MP71]